MGYPVVSPFSVTIYSKTLVPVADINNPSWMSVTPRHNQTPSMQLALPLNHPKLDHCMEPGNRIVVLKDGEFLYSGPISLVSAEGPTRSGSATFTSTGDYGILHEIIGWPVPGSAISSQGAAEYWTMTGPAETVAKALFNANKGRRVGPAITTLPDLGRGATVTITCRMQPLSDVLFPAIEEAGLGIKIWQDGTTMKMDVYETSTYPITLTEESGVIQSWGFSSAAPTATDIIIGGSGEGKLRRFQSTSDVPRANAWGRSVEVFQDARGAGEFGDPEYAAAMAEAGKEALADGAPKGGFSVRLSDSGIFSYGKGGLVVGSQVTIALGLATRADVLRSCTFSWTNDRGIDATPVVGDIQDDPDKTLGDFLNKMRRNINDIRAAR